ncbi:hypothetical protein [Methylocystis sp.]|uniref:hypothetical protein n=1 Tax=Methylocystis sp. TaxID=1911079 RepID=UPI003D0B17D8
MDATLSAAAVLIGAPNAQFLALMFIGGVVGWCATKLSRFAHLAERVDCRLGALLLVGVTGAWLAAEFAVRAGIGPRGADSVLVAGAIGAALFCLAWRSWHYLDGTGGDIAVHH